MLEIICECGAEYKWLTDMTLPLNHKCFRKECKVKFKVRFSEENTKEKPVKKARRKS